MPSRDHYIENGEQAHVGAQSLLAMIGGSKNLTAGWAGFAVKTMLVCSSAATVFGLTSWMLFQGPLGPALSFLSGSGFGFIGGLVSRWRSDVAEALHLSDQYPLLIEHHLRLTSDAVRELDGKRYADWAADLRRNLRKQGMVVAAMYSAAPALDRIRQEEEELLIALYASRRAEAAVETDGE